MRKETVTRITGPLNVGPLGLFQWLIIVLIVALAAHVMSIYEQLDEQRQTIEILRTQVTDLQTMHGGLHP